MTESRPRTWLLVSAVYVALVLACFSPWWLQGRVFAPLDILNEMLLPWRAEKTYPNVHNHFVSDAVTQYLPYHLLAFQSLREDGYIGWNPYSETGTPFHANTMALPGDWTLQLYRVFDFWTGWHVGLVGQFLLAGLGMLALLRNRGITPWCALAGAIVFAGNAQFIIWFYHRWALGAFCWMPWIFWALFRWRQGRPGAIPLAIGFLAFSFLGGTLQHLVYTVLALVCFWFGEILVKPGKPGQKIKATLVFALIGLGAVLAAAPTLIPSAQAYFESKAAGDTRGGIGYPQGLLQPVMNAVAYGFFIFPSILGSPQTMDAWKLLKTGLFDLGWLGTIPTLFAFLAIFRRSSPFTSRLLVIVALVIPLTPLVGPLYHRVLLLFAFGGAWAFADFLSNSPASARSRFARWVGLGTAGIITCWLIASFVLIWIAPTLKTKVSTFVRPRLAQSQFGMFEQWFLDRAGNFVDSLFIWNSAQLPLVILALLALGLIFLGSSRRVPDLYWQGPLALVLGLELFLLAARWITVVDLKEFPAYASNPEIEEVRRLVGDGRIYTGIGGKSIADVPFAPNIPTAFKISHLDVYESIRPAGLWAREKYSTSKETLKKLGVTHLLEPAGSPAPEGCTTVFSGPSVTVQALEDAPSPSHGKIISPNHVTVSGITPGAASTLAITPSTWWRIQSGSNGSPVALESTDGGLRLPALSVPSVELYYRPPFLIRHPSFLAAIVLLLGLGAQAASRRSEDRSSSLPAR
jgi:hypothetical protein